MEIILTHNYKIRRTDPLNWQLYELRDVEKRTGRRGKKTGAKEREWVALGIYPRDVESACFYVLDKNSEWNKDERITLEDAIERLQAIAADVMQHVNN